MSNAAAIINRQDKIKALIFDILAVTAVYLVPTFSHLIGFPLYLLEPMRLMIILAFVHTRRENAYILALTLPIVSYLFSGHPVFFKMIIISVELMANVWLFILLQKYIGNRFLSSFLSVILSKLLYYCVKYILISLLIIDGALISTPIIYQIAVSIGISIYVAIFLKRNMN